MTEFALVLPLLVLILFAIIQFGIAFNNYLALTDAVRVGARKGATARQLSDPPGATVAAVRNAAANLKQSDLQVSVESSWVPLEDVRVTASYPYSISLMGWVVKSGRLHSEAVNRVEQ